MDLESNHHSVFSLNFHLIFVVKYRREVFNTKDRKNLLYTTIMKVADEFNVAIKEMKTDKDHIHILFSCQPTLKIPMFVKKAKGISSRALRLKNPSLKFEVHNKYLWSPSYFITTTGGVTIDKIKKYIESQGK